ncbi:MAG: DUF2087 domain-containing protein [Polyangiaceae bacterium]|nr:DUF2087 domain-containing protein [Polyangiaceae bacterium]
MVAARPLDAPSVLARRGAAHPVIRWRYREREVNERIHALFDDHCTIRRLLIEEGYMARENARPGPAREHRGSAPRRDCVTWCTLASP